MLLGLILADEDHPARSRAELRNTFCQRWNSWWVLFSFSLEMLKQKTWRCITGSKWLSMGYMYCIWTNGKWLQTIGGWWTLRLRKRGGYGLLVKTRVHWWAPQFLLNGCPLPTYICIIYIYIFQVLVLFHPSACMKIDGGSTVPPPSMNVNFLDHHPGMLPSSPV
jgi:hypothetical protein